MNARVVFCDDIRLESTGKYILIGVYTGQMSLLLGPTLVTLATWIEISDLAEGTRIVDLKVLFGDTGKEELVSSASFSIAVTMPELPAYLWPTGLHFDSKNGGTLKVSVAVDGEDIPTSGVLHIRPGDLGAIPAPS